LTMYWRESWARPAGRALFASLAEPRQIPNAGSRVSTSGHDPIAHRCGSPPRGQSVPRAPLAPLCSRFCGCPVNRSWRWRMVSQIAPFGARPYALSFWG
jgi:hypothetical protein